MNLIPWKNKSQKSDLLPPADTTLARFRSEFDELFDRFFRDPWGASTSWMRREAGPRMDLAESDSEVVVKAELPGVDPKEIEINVTGQVLTLRGEKKADREERGEDFHYVERQYGSFQRSIPLPTAVDADRVAAEYKNGVLTVTLPKHPGAKPRRITVRPA